MPPIKTDELQAALDGELQDQRSPIPEHEEENGDGMMEIMALADADIEESDFTSAITVKAILETDYEEGRALCVLECHKDQVDEVLMEMEQLHSLDVVGLVSPCLDLSVPAVEVNDCWYAVPDQAPPYVPPWLGSANGEGVVIGIVDSGIDWSHDDFKNDDGTTRIKWIRELISNTEWTNVQIDAAQCTCLDTNGHGTALAGIACGNGKATGNSELARRYVGMAPKADILVVKVREYINANYPESDMATGMSWCRGKAALLDKPLVLLVAGVARLNDAHRGQQPLASSMSAIGAIGGPQWSAVAVAAAGNEAMLGRHAWSHISGDAGVDVTTFQFVVPAHPWRGDSEYFRIYGYFAMGATALQELECRLIDPNGLATGWARYSASQTVSWPNFDGQHEASFSYITTEGNPRFMRIRCTGTTFTDGVPMTAGTWTIEVRRIAGVQRSKEIDWYLDQWTFHPTLYFYEPYAPYFITKAVNYRTIGSPANGRRVLAVGAYNHRAGWTDVNGVPRTYADAPPVGKLVPTSGRGNNWDNYPKPEFVAPGCGIITALSTQMTTPPTAEFIADDGVHQVVRGTSFAAAHVAGLAALVFQRLNKITIERLRSILGTAATVDTDTGIPHSPHYGFGKIHSACGPTVASGPYIGVTHLSNTTFQIRCHNAGVSGSGYAGFKDSTITAGDSDDQVNGGGSCKGYCEDTELYIQTAITNKTGAGIVSGTTEAFDLHHEEQGDGLYWYQLVGLTTNKNNAPEPLPVVTIIFTMTSGVVSGVTIDAPPPGDLVSETGRRARRRDY